MSRDWRNSILPARSSSPTYSKRSPRPTARQLLAQLLQILLIGRAQVSARQGDRRHPRILSQQHKRVDQVVQPLIRADAGKIADHLPAPLEWTLPRAVAGQFQAVRDDVNLQPIERCIVAHEIGVIAIEREQRRRHPGHAGASNWRACAAPGSGELFEEDVLTRQRAHDRHL